MCIRVLILAVIGFSGGNVWPHQGQSDKQGLKHAEKLWAAISVNKLISVKGTDKVVIHFAIVNDGSRVVDPAIGSSQLFINGKELKEWPFSASQGIRDGRFTALPPGDYLSFAYDLSRHFQKVGIYKVSWKGDAFEAPEITFRLSSKDGSEPKK
jgi:hypothetical protein